MSTLFWRDMLCVGTVVNMLATFIALMATSQDAPTWATVAIHFAPLPYNIFLFAAVRRTMQRSRIAVTVSFIWLALMMLV